MDYEEWKASGIPEQIQRERFETRKKQFVTGDFSKMSYADFPVNTGGFFNDPPQDESTWRYEKAQEIDKIVRGLADQIKKSGPASLPRTEPLSGLEKDIVQEFFEGDATRWSNYLLSLQSRFGKINLLGVVYYIRAAGLP